jgi:hypothetical protein
LPSGPRSTRAWSSALALAVAGGCATPSRHLTTRAIDDPAVLPRGLASLSVGTWAERLDTTGRWSWASVFGFRYGITDRLELDRLTLAFAWLDDAPPPSGTPPGTRRPPVSLILRGGVNGIGWASLEGFIALPTLSVELAKHVTERVRLSAQLGWDGTWVANPQPEETLYTAYLWPNTDRRSELLLSAGALIQVADHVSVRYGASVHQLDGCFVPTCAAAARGFATSLGPSFRPWRWLVISVAGYAGARWRRTNPVLPAPALMPPDLPPTQVSWLGVSGALTFLW